MLTNSQKEHLTYTLIWQIVTLVALGILTSSYILPGFDKISTNITAANAQIEKYKAVEKDWLSFEEVSTLVSSKGEYAELLKIMNSDAAGTREVLKKTAPEELYLDWIKESINNSTDDQNIITQYKVKLNSIIPTLNPISGNTTEDNITLKTYIKFIETQILKKFSLDANLVLWMDGINVGSSATSWMPENVGTFELQISFKATNKNISDFIAYINNSGNPELLTSTGIIAKDKMPLVMSNPLITVKDFWLTEPLDSKLPDEENSGRITINFYVRGISKDDITYLKENLKLRNEELKTAIEKAQEECKNQGALCGKVKDQLDLVMLKYRQFNASIITTATQSDNVSQMYNLAQRASTLRSIEEEFKKITESTSK